MNTQKLLMWHPGAVGDPNPPRKPLTLDQTESFSQWLDAKGDSLAAPTSFDDWLAQNGDAI